MQIWLNVPPMGDAVMTTAVARKLAKLGHEPIIFTNKLWAPLVKQYVAVAVDERAPEGAVQINVCEYLLQPGSCHRAPAPSEYHHTDDPMNRGDYAHLVTWIGYHVTEQLRAAGVALEYPLVMSAKDVTLPVSVARREEARDFLDKSLPGFQSKPLVLLCAAAGSPNRNVPPDLLRAVAQRLQDKALVALVQPLPKDVPGYDLIPAVLLPMIPTEILGATFWLAHAFVGPDTGPTHVAAAVRPPDHASEVIWVCGSSNPLVLAYPGNQWVETAPGVCPVRPCGHHGYTPVPEHEGDGDFTVYTLGKKTGCIFESYIHPPHLAPCLVHIQACEIVNRISATI